MIDKSHTPRSGMFYSINRVESILGAAQEHATHGWTALEQEMKVNRLNPDAWPPQVEAEVGSAQYHLANTIALLTEAYWLVRKEQEHIEEVMKKVNAVLDQENCHRYNKTEGQ